MLLNTNDSHADKWEKARVCITSIEKSLNSIDVAFAGMSIVSMYSVYLYCNPLVSKENAISNEATAAVVRKK